MNITAKRLHTYLLLASEATLLACSRQGSRIWSAIALIGLILLPGTGLLLWMRAELRTGLERLLAAVCLSVVTLILTGLVVNELGPLLGDARPLEKAALLLPLAAIMTALPLVSYLRNRNMTYHFSRLHLSPRLLLAATGLLCLPALSALGAISLNNGAPATITLVMLTALVISAVALVVAHRHVPDWLYGWAVFMIGLALLFSTSLRGWHVTGHDLQLEYYVYQLTVNASHWSIAAFRDPYNACMSLTILPASLRALTGVDGLVQFKLLYPVFMALTAGGVYALSRRLAVAPIAFVAAWLFVTFPTFYQDMPMLARQETAFMFFAAFLIVLFAGGIKIWPRRILIAAFGIGMVLSHYSTTFVAVGLIGGAYALGLPEQLRNRRRHISYAEHQQPAQRALSIGAVALIGLGAVIWTGLITHTGGNIVQTVQGALANLGTILHPAAGEDNAYALIKTAVTPPAKLLVEYATSQAASTSAASVGGYYAAAAHATLSVAAAPLGNLTNTGLFLRHLNVTPNTIYATIKSGYALIIQGLLIVGTAFIFIRRRRLGIPSDLVYLAPVALALVVIQVVLPVIDYGLYRMLQQDLIFLALPTVLGGLWFVRLLRIKSQRVGLTVITVILGVSFLVVSGWFGAITGGTPDQLTVANSGFYYDSYATTDTDTAAFTWIDNNFPRNYPINADTFTRAKLRAATGITSIDGIAPQQIGQDSYVVVSKPIIKTGIISFYYGGDLLYAHYPTSFLDNEKDLLYTSGSEEVYR